MNKMVKKDDSYKLPKPKKHKRKSYYLTEQSIQNILITAYDTYNPDLIELVKCLYHSMKKYSDIPSYVRREYEGTDEDFYQDIKKMSDARLDKLHRPEKINLANLNDEMRIGLILSLIFGCDTASFLEKRKKRGSQSFDKEDAALLQEMYDYMNLNKLSIRRVVDIFEPKIPAWKRLKTGEFDENDESANNGHIRRMRKKLKEFKNEKEAEEKKLEDLNLATARLMDQSYSDLFSDENIEGGEETRHEFERLEYENSGIHDIRDWLLKNKKLILKLYQEDSSRNNPSTKP